jgi:LemA protein
LGWLILGLVAVVLFWIVAIFNGLVRARNAVDNAWAQIDVQLKKRADLVPNLVETVKGYARHEQTVFENVTRARAMVNQAGSPQEAAKAENMLTGALKTLFAVAERYPDLKASENFRLLQEDLGGLESKIAYARQFYNDSVNRYHNSQETFPANLMAAAFGHRRRQFFETESEADRQPPRVSFD